MVDHNMNRGSLNSSVLALNVGTNTLEVGNPNVHKNTTEFTHQIQTIATTDKKKAIADTFESNDECSSKSNGLKRMHDKEDDPEWVPDKRASKSNCSSDDSFKLKAKEAAYSNPQVNRRDSWLMYEPLSGPQPSYLKILLEYFGWKVEFQGDKYKYVSPNGVPYYSNQKAYETFLDITSKYNQKGGILSGHLQTSFYLDTTSGYSGMGIGNIASNIKKKKRSQRKKVTNFENIFRFNNCTGPIRTITKKPVQALNSGAKCHDDERGLSIGFNQQVCNLGRCKENNIDQNALNETHNIVKYMDDESTNLDCQKRWSNNKGIRLPSLRKTVCLNKKANISCREEDLTKQEEHHSFTNIESGPKKTVGKKSTEILHGNNRRMGFNGSSSLSSLNAKRMHSHIRRSIHANGKIVHVNDDSDADLVCEENISEFETDVEDNPHKEKKPTETLPFPNLNGPLKKTNPEILISENDTISNRKMKEKKRGGCGLSIRRNGMDDYQDEIIAYGKLNLITQLIELGTLAENDRICFVLKNSNTKTTGLVTKDGIKCCCCKESMSLSKFVAHANGSLENIFLASGKTFLSCMKEAWEKEKVQRKVGFKNIGLGDPDPSDDTCAICADGGHLICCDSCPSTFHQSCLMLETLPPGSWYCPYCICKICRAHGSANMLSCKECGYKYHKDSCWENDMHLMGSVPFSFCGKSCKNVKFKNWHSNVSAELPSILGKKNQTGDGFSWTLLKCLDEDTGNIPSERLSSVVESNIKLSLALSVLDECYDSLIDRWTGIDMLCQAVYNCGSNFKRLNYEGFYTLILERDDDIISVASLRLHGTSLAEMPFIGTRFMYRKQGMCRRLIKGIEDMLRELRVEKLVIPAIPDMMETWTKSFSFEPLKSSHKEEIMNMSLMVFTGITLLQKPIYISTSVPKAVQTDKNAKRLNNNTQQKKEVPSFLNGQGSSAHRFKSPTGPQRNINTQSGLGNNFTAVLEQPKPNTSSHFVSKGLSLGNSSNVFGTDSRNLVKNGENIHTSLEIQNRQNSIQESQNVPNLYCNESILDDEWGIYASYLKGNIDIMKPPNDTTCNGTVMKSADKGKAHVSSTKASSKSCDGFVPETLKADAANIASSSNADVNGQSRSSDDVMDLEVLAMISLDNLLRSE